MQQTYSVNFNFVGVHTYNPRTLHLHLSSVSYKCQFKIVSVLDLCEIAANSIACNVGWCGAHDLVFHALENALWQQNGMDQG
jgi:hypothetical protein